MKRRGGLMFSVDEIFAIPLRLRYHNVDKNVMIHFCGCEK